MSRIQIWNSNILSPFWKHVSFQVAAKTLSVKILVLKWQWNWKAAASVFFFWWHNQETVKNERLTDPSWRCPWDQSERKDLSCLRCCSFSFDQVQIMVFQGTSRGYQPNSSWYSWSGMALVAVLLDPPPFPKERANLGSPVSECLQELSTTNQKGAFSKEA